MKLLPLFLCVLSSLFLQYCDAADDGPEAVTRTIAELQKRATAEKQVFGTPGKTTVWAYSSKIDRSAQPFAIGVPEGYKFSGSAKRWPLYVVLHGRQGNLNEANFFNKFNGKSYSQQNYLQLDVFGRGNNAFRWSGETDVFEAMAAVKRRFRIDERRIVLWGFSMGGAGAWHLGLHHPSVWASAGAGAGFSDTHRYLKIEDPLPPHQEKALTIYDAERYAANASIVPFITYGGENDKQILASQIMEAATKREEVPLQFLIGPKMGHKFDPESKRKFMAFHEQNAKSGRPTFPGKKNFKFVTYTLKYNRAEWIVIEEMIRMYKPARLNVEFNDLTGEYRIETENIATLRIDRSVGSQVSIDGDILPLESAADGLLPWVYYSRGAKEWFPINYERSKEFASNPDMMKRHGLQGPIDDAFTDAFICVSPTGQPWNAELNDYAKWSLTRLQKEWKAWLHGEVITKKDTAISEEDIANSNLILFGDPGSNAVLGRLVEKLPLTWTKETITFGGRKIDPTKQVVVLIYPNPLNPRKYVVINSGHTFHEAEFRGSNSQLYPRIGDYGVLTFRKDAKAGYVETTEMSDYFNGGWRFPSAVK